MVGESSIMPAASDSPVSISSERDESLPRRRADAERSVRAIVRAATQVLGQDPHASMLEIATASGLGRATVYRHFPSREELVLAIRKESSDACEAMITDCRLHEGPASEALSRLVKGFIHIGDRYGVIAHTYAGMEPNTREREEEVTRPILELMERGQREGEFRTDVSARFLRSAILDMAAVAVREITEGSIAAEEAPDLLTSILSNGICAQRSDDG
jgi:AcrR family transcriptional regulator